MKGLKHLHTLFSDSQSMSPLLLLPTLDLPVWDSPPLSPIQLAPGPHTLCGAKAIGSGSKKELRHIGWGERELRLYSRVQNHAKKPPCTWVIYQGMQCAPNLSIIVIHRDCSFKNLCTLHHLCMGHTCYVVINPCIEFPTFMHEYMHAMHVNVC